MKILKILFTSLSLALLIPTNVATTATEFSIESTSDTITVQDYTSNVHMDLISDNSTDVSDLGFAEPEAITITIKFGSMVVGWIVAGVITWATGRPPSEWIAIGIDYVVNQIVNVYNYLVSRGGGQIHVSSNGQVSGCITFPCAIQAREPAY